MGTNYCPDCSAGANPDHDPCAVCAVWISKFSGKTETEQTKTMAELVAENARLKRELSDAMKKLGIQRQGRGPQDYDEARTIAHASR